MGMFGTIGATGTSEMGANMEIGLTLIGRMMAQGDYDKADEMYQQMLQEMEKTEIPKFQELVAQEVSNQTQMQQGSSGRTAQQGALDKLSSFIDQGGLDDQARGALQQSLSAEDQQNRGNQAAIMSSRARRGMSGSGDELSAALSSQQGSANQGRNSGLEIAGQARQRALDALGKYGQQAGSMRGQDISIDKANMDAAQQRDMFNSKMRFAAAQGNNEGHMTEAMARMQRAEALNKARQNQANRYLQRAKQTQGDYASVGRGLNMKSQTAAEGFEDMPF